MRVPCGLCKTEFLELLDGSPITTATRVMCKKCSRKAASLQAEEAFRKTDAKETGKPSHGEVAAAVLGSTAQGENSEEDHESFSALEDQERAALAEDGEAG